MSRPQERTEYQNPEPIDLTVMVEDFFRTMRKRWLLVVLAVLVCAAGYTWMQHRSYVPRYTAESTFVISSSADSQNTGNYYDDQLARQMAKTFPYILTSEILRDRIGAELGTGYVPGTIRASVMANTNFLTISVTDTDPQRAYQTLQAELETAPELTEAVAGKIYMELMDESGVPSGPDNPLSLKAAALKGGLAGLAVGLGLVVLMIFTHRTIRREEDCLSRINTKCLGVVPRIRMKVRSRKVEQHLNIHKKHADDNLVEAFRIIRNRLERRAAADRLKTILITSTLPGEGKSTVAVNTAIALAQAGKKVALIDCDLRNPSDSAILEARQGSGLVDFLRGSARFSDCLLSGQDVLGEGYPLLFLRGGKPVQDVTGLLASERMKNLVSTLEKQMDYVILDAAPVGLLTDAGILAQYADGAVFVVRQDYTKVDRVLEAMEQLTDTRCEILGCILNDDN